ncbi:hypothetical protein QTP88_013387 [Uroleucon formosanum]
MKSDVGEGRAVKNGYAGGCTEPIINMECAQGKLIEREQIRMKNTPFCVDLTQSRNSL